MPDLFDTAPEDTPTPDADPAPRPAADPYRWAFVAPAYRDQPGAEAFDAYLDYHCRWSAADFGGQWAWETAIPARQDWWNEVERFNVHLRQLEREEVTSGTGRTDGSSATDRAGTSEDR